MNYPLVDVATPGVSIFLSLVAVRQLQSALGDAERLLTNAPTDGSWQSYSSFRTFSQERTQLEIPAS